jgi:hypothetical protein
MGPARRFVLQQGAFSPLAVLALGLGLAGCAPEIGDDCKTSLDCSPAGDRLCDVSQPGGYCTIYNCEDSTEDDADAAQGACPEEAACVVFARTPSAVCEEPEGDSAYQRTFCMFRCENDTDCRTDEGYRCLDLSNPATWSAVVIDRRPADERKTPIKVCSQPYDGEPVPPERVADGESEPICDPEPARQPAPSE